MLTATNTAGTPSAHLSLPFPLSSPSPGRKGEAQSNSRTSRYHIYKYGRYPIPNDDIEYGREGVRHALFKELLDGRLLLAPIGESPHKIVDLGTGFGDWAIEGTLRIGAPCSSSPSPLTSFRKVTRAEPAAMLAGELYPSAEVLGIDLSPVQPSWVPPNVKFIVDDIEDPEWIHGSDCDYVHIRMTTLAVKNPVEIIVNIFRYACPSSTPASKPSLKREKKKYKTS